MGEVKEKGEERILEVPFEAKEGSILCVLFWARCDGGSGCDVYVRTGGERIRFGRMGQAPEDNWKHLRAFYPVKKDMSGVIQIAAPAARELAAGKVWIDYLMVTVIEKGFEWPAYV